MTNNTNGGVSVAKESEARSFVYGIFKYHAGYIYCMPVRMWRIFAGFKCILMKNDQQV